jgi:hypothetical protein
VRFLQFTASPPVTTSPSNDPENDSRAGEPLKATRITGRWDDAPRPALDAPVGDFFGTGFGQAQNYDTILAGMHTATGVLPPSFPHPSEVSALGKPGGVSTYAFWPMPFAEHGELALTNTLPAGGPTVEVAYEVDYAPAAIRHHNDGTLWRGREELGYFHAREFHNRSQPANSPHPEREANDGFARLKGRGNYAGHVLNMTINAAAKSIDDLHYMEGDCMFWVDGAPDYLPDITSTGHEECHDAAPYFEFLANNPTADTTNRDACGVIVFCTTVGETSVFRWWMGDTIAFQHRFEATVEHGSENTYAGGDYAGGSLADESGVAFYYLQSAPIVLLPPARRCVSRRHFRIRLRVPQRGRVRSATVFVGKRRVAVRRGKRLTTRVNLRRLPKGRFVVRVRLRLRSGRTITLRRVYHTCAHHRPR